jgi:hypothetical protein
MQPEAASKAHECTNSAPCPCEANRIERQRIAQELAREIGTVPSVYSESAHEAKLRRENAGRIPIGYTSGTIGPDQQLRAPGKMFSREKFLAILHAKQAECRSPRRMGLTPDGLIVLAELVDVVENLE